MDIQAVSAEPAFYAACVVCGRKVLSSAEPLFADLDGKAWTDYYCVDHVNLAGR